jgi:hypothetical protein
VSKHEGRSGRNRVNRPIGLVDDLETHRRGILAGEDKIRPPEEEWAGDWSAIAICVRTDTQGWEVQRFVESTNRDGDTTPQAKTSPSVPVNGEPATATRPSAIALCVRMQWPGIRS